MWRWEKSESFDRQLQELQDNEVEIPMTCVDCYGNPVKVGGEMTAFEHDRTRRNRGMGGWRSGESTCLPSGGYFVVGESWCG